MSLSTGFRIADPGLAPQGEQAMAWVRRHSPVLNDLARSQLHDGLVRGKRVALVVHLEAKTAYLATMLADAGAQVVVAGSNPHSTRDEVAAALVARGIRVYSSRASSYEQWENDLLAVADTGPQFVIDDGVELTLRMARARPDLFGKLRGVTEETTTGVSRLRALERSGELSCPAIAANDALCKHLFDNRYGTGQSTITAILRLTNLLLAGTCVAVIGYGWVGRGLSNYTTAMGGRVVVLESDPVRALEAVMDGHTVTNAASGLPRAQIIVTATGGSHALGHAELAYLRPDAVLANAGHHDREIDVDALEQAATARVDAREGVTSYTLEGGRTVHLLSRGALVNIAGGAGHAVEIMDLSFTVQALALHRLVRGGLERGVHQFPRELDDEIARAKLRSYGAELVERLQDDDVLKA